jgi:hypothetical protein
MAKKILVGFFALFVAFSVSAQTANDTITVTKLVGGCKFEQNGSLLTYGKMAEMMKSNPEAYSYMQKANGSMGVATVLSFVGGFAIGWQLGAAIGGGKPNWGIAGAGGALIVISIPIASSSSKDAARAVEIYNNAIKESTPKTGYDLKVGLKSSGLALTLNF